MALQGKRLRWVVPAVLVLLAVGLGALHRVHPLPYVYRVFAYRDAGYEDIHRFPARGIAGADTPSELQIALDPRVDVVFTQHPDVASLESLLRETETTAFLVAHQGRLVVERYLLGNNAASMQNSFSVSKSVMSALMGLAVRDGALELDEPVTTYLPELAARDPRFAEIRVDHLLDMRSGIRFDDDVVFPVLNCDNPLIYYHPDLESVVLERTEIASAPGDFLYNNYNPPLIGLILRRTTGMPVGAYMERELWKPLGAEAAAGWTVDDHGVERMESGFHACARDMMRFGLLYLYEGTVGSKRVLPEDWVLASTETPTPFDLEPDRFNGRTWGYHHGWWIVPRAEGRSDFCAIGRFGQFIYVSPQHDVVFVRNGPDRGEWGDGDWTALFHFVAERL